MGRIIRTFLAGVLALLPIAVTLFVIAWIASLLASYAGPGSFIGRLITRLGTSLGLDIGPSSGAAYLLGFLVILGCIFVLGLVVETRLWPWVQNGLDALMMRIPIVSNVYDLSKRFVSLVDRGDQGDLKSMRPVWCFFGGEGGAAVLGLMPSPEPVMIGEHSLSRPAGAVGAGAVRRRADLCAVGLGQAGRRRRRAADECLCVDGRDPADVDAGRRAAGCKAQGDQAARFAEIQVLAFATVMAGLVRPSTT